MSNDDFKGSLESLVEKGWLEKVKTDKKSRYQTSEKSRKFIADMIRDYMDLNKYSFTFEGQKELDEWIKTGNKTQNVIDMIDLLIVDMGSVQMPIVMLRTKKTCSKCDKLFFKIVGTKDALCLCEERTSLDKIKEKVDDLEE